MALVLDALDGARIAIVGDRGPAARWVVVHTRGARTDAQVPGAYAVVVTDGHSVAQVRSDTSAPILAMADEMVERLVAFGLGADDVVSASVDPAELASRLNALVRRRRWPKFSDAWLACGDLRISEDTREVQVAGEGVCLTMTEFAVLLALMRSGGQTVSRHTLAERLRHDEDTFPALRSVDAHIYRLRHKVGRGRIRCVSSIGYRVAA